MRSKTLEINQNNAAVIKFKNVNNDMVAEDLVEFASEILINSFYFLSDSNTTEMMEAIADSIDYFCTNLLDQNIIQQFDVICDRRNNNSKDIANGFFNLEITYRQTHCLNVTSVLYEISPIESPVAEITAAANFIGQW